jgi:hypothetical protein
MGVNWAGKIPCNSDLSFITYNQCVSVCSLRLFVTLYPQQLALFSVTFGWPSAHVLAFRCKHSSSFSDRPTQQYTKGNRILSSIHQKPTIWPWIKEQPKIENAIFGQNKRKNASHYEKFIEPEKQRKSHMFSEKCQTSNVWERNISETLWL